MSSVGRLDDLRSSEGSLFSRVQMQSWVKPKSVTLKVQDSIETALGPDFVNFLRRAMERPPNAGTAPDHGSMLMITLDRFPGQRIGLRGARVRPKPDLLEKFLGLADASDTDICRFAARFGGLQIFYRVEQVLGDEVVVSESCEVWRYFARTMRSLLRIAAAFRSELTQNPRPLPDRQDWETIGSYPDQILFHEHMVGLIEQQAKEVAKTICEDHNLPRFPIHALSEERSMLRRNEVDLFEPSGGTGEAYWRTQAQLAWILKPIANRRLWALLLTSLLDLGRVRAWMGWHGPSGRKEPRMAFSGPNLLSYLSLQVGLLACARDSYAVCSYCNKEYALKRIPKAGQKNYCPECRGIGVPVRIAQRERQLRIRAGKTQKGGDHGKTRTE